MTNIETHLKQLETEIKIRGLSKHTARMYLLWNRLFLEYIDKPPKKIEANDIKQYMAYLMTDKEYNNKTVAHALAALEFYYNEVLGIGIPYIKRPKKTRELPTILTKEDIKLMLQSTKNPKHKLIIELLYSSGLRVSELCNLKYADLDLNQKIGWVRKGKGAKDRIFILSESFCKDLIDYPHEPNDIYIFHRWQIHNHKNFIDQPMTPFGVQQAIKAIANRAGIKKNVHPHTFRHSFATHLLESDVDIRKIQTLLGHESLATTQLYTQVSSEQIKKIKSPMDTL